MSTGPLSDAQPFAGLVDDAAMFPPASMSPAVALEAHLAQLRTDHAALVGPLLVADRSVPALAKACDALGAAVHVVVVVTSGAGAVGPAVAQVGRHGCVRLQGLEIALRDEDNLRGNAERVATVLDLELPDGATAAVELPRLGDGQPAASWGEAADTVAAAGHRLKFRTGGEWADAHPPSTELAMFLVAALDRESQFKLTAGLHHAVRHTSTEGYEQHGFLNVLLATQALLSGASAGDAVAVLEQRDSGIVAKDVTSWDASTAASVRRWFVSFGSCSIDEPVADLRDLGLLG